MGQFFKRRAESGMSGPDSISNLFSHLKQNACGGAPLRHLLSLTGGREASRASTRAILHILQEHGYIRGYRTLDVGARGSPSVRRSVH